ncbi:ABC transporter ATP-binding protein [Ilumatobacter sp.]|uniref:ABC transporter ATP-binding protein n=1 Tax=Ilumatobacter sp. TaxID=1967498 RepID=UPI003AF54AA2
MSIGTPSLELESIVFERDGKRILDDITMRVRNDRRWLVLGANGSGKTSLLRIAAMYEHPSSGTVRVLGEALGRTDVRQLRRRVGYASAALASQFRPALAACDVVVTAKYAALEPWWHQYTDADRAQAFACLERMGVGGLGHRSLGTLSSGEQQRVLLARTLMNDPEVVLLDEPSARLDLGGREQLVRALAELAAQPGGPPFVLVTHHVDEVPDGVTDALLLRDGCVVSQGPIDEALTAATLSECFRMDLALERRPDGRLSAWARR